MSKRWRQIAPGAALLAVTTAPVHGQAARAAACAPNAKPANLNFTLKDLLKAFGPMPGLPTTFIIARDGKVCSSHTGLGEKATFEQAINALL